MNEEILIRLKNVDDQISSNVNGHSFSGDMVNAILQLNNAIKELQKRSDMVIGDIKHLRDHIVNIEEILGE